MGDLEEAYKAFDEIHASRERNKSTFWRHETAVIDEPCLILDGTKIWHWCHVMEDATIGRNCTLGQNVFVGRKAIIGDRVKIQNNVSVYEGLIIDSDVFIGPSVVFTNVKYPRAFEPADAFQATWVKHGATIGANATILPGIVIGEYAMIGAGAVVTRNVPPYALMVGNPARQVGWVDQEGRQVHDYRVV